MRLDAEVGGHAGQDHLVNAVLAQLQHQVVLLRTIHLVGRGNNGLVVENIGLVLRHEIGAGVLESFHRVRAAPIEHAHLVHEFFKRAFKLPALVGRIVVMR